MGNYSNNILPDMDISEKFPCPKCKLVEFSEDKKTLGDMTDSQYGDYMDGFNHIVFHVIIVDIAN